MAVRRVLSTIGRVRSAVASLQPGDQVCMPCSPDRWETVRNIRDLSDGDYVWFSIDMVGGVGHGGEIPLKIRRTNLSPPTTPAEPDSTQPA